MPALVTMLTRAPQALHAEGADPAPVQLGEHLLLEAPVVGVHHVQRHQDGGPVVGLAEHLEVDRGVLVAGEAQEADLALLQGLQAGLDGAVLGEDPVGVVVVDDLVELPEVDAGRS